MIDTDQLVVIEPPRGWQFVDFRELRQYRDLFYFLVWRDIKVLYAQTILGFSWAILNPLIQIVIFTVIFGKVAKLDTEGIPYVLYTTVAIIPWTYMSESMSQASMSLVSHQGMLGKIYFPRVLYPLTSVVAKLVDFAISLSLILVVMVWYGIAPTWNFLLLPVFVLTMVIIPASVGLLLSALAIRYRDVKFAMPFLIRMLIYTAPIIYSAASIPENYRILYSINPIVAVIEGFRGCLLGAELQWQYILPGMGMALFLLTFSALYFRRMERVFVDVI